jgi:hypothetical protein
MICVIIKTNRIDSRHSIDWLVFVEETKNFHCAAETQFFGALAKFRKETITLVTSAYLSVRLSVCVYLRPHGTTLLHEI